VYLNEQQLGEKIAIGINKKKEKEIHPALAMLSASLTLSAKLFQSGTRFD